VARSSRHLEFLDEAIGNLSAEIERVIAPFEAEVELLSTIAGVQRRTAEDADRGDRVEHEPGSLGGAPGPRGPGCGPGQRSAGKHRSGRPAGLEVAPSALTESARAAARSKGT